MRSLAGGAAATGPTAAVAAAAGGAAAIAGAPLLAAPPRMLRAPSASSAAGAGAAGGPTSTATLAGTASSRAPATPHSRGASPAASQYGVEGLAGEPGRMGGVRSGGLGGAATDDDAEDVSALGAAARSAPWEPRMWEWDLDRSVLERQRFRRWVLGRVLGRVAGGWWSARGRAGVWACTSGGGRC